MPLTLAEAMEIARRQLDQMEVSCPGQEGFCLLPENIETFDVGWFFFYQSARFIETGDFADSLVGNAPLFVSQSDGNLFFVSYHRPLAESMAAYRACGNPNAEEIPEVCLGEWQQAVPALAAIQVLRRHTSLGMLQAREVIESCRAGHAPVVVLRSMEEARALVAALLALGLGAEVCYA